MIIDDLRRKLDSVFVPWAAREGIGSLPPYALDAPPAGFDADVACNLALLLAKALKTTPRNLAQKLAAFIPLGGDIEAVSVAGAGFINIRWTLDRLQREIGCVLEEKGRYGSEKPSSPGKVLIEFVSANPTGPLHVGHGRGAALGDSLSRILAHLGLSVTREYYINDAGNQVRMLGESILARVAELEGKPVPFPENGYHGDYVKELARDYVKRPGAPPSQESAVAFGLDRMLRLIWEDLSAFGVHFDGWFSEKSLLENRSVDAHVELLKKRGRTETAEGALWFVAPGEEDTKDKNRVLQKRDGTWTYFATDIAYHAGKFERGFDRIINVWGADHHGYVPRVKGAMAALGFDPGHLHIILNQMVALTRDGVPVSMSKRTGEFVTLRDVLDEVGRDACRFFFALRSPNTALEFDLELAKRQTVDNPVYYVQYAHARICSVFHQASERGIPAAAADPAALGLLKETEERELMKRLALFPQVLAVCAREDSPHPLANYLLQLGRQFHHYYDHHRVLGENVSLSRSRLALLEAVRQVLALGLSLLGVSAPEKM